MSQKITWLTGVRTLLAPAVPQCLTCGKRGRPSSQMPGICRSCEEVIPWIRFPRCLKCGRHVGCPDCTRSSEPSPIVCNRSAVAYSSVMREWLGQYKYRGNERYAPLLGLMLDRAYVTLKEEREKEVRSTLLSHKRSINTLFQNKHHTHGRSWQADLLVPVPVSDSRLMERGFNQAERLANKLSQLKRIPQLQLLIRTHHTGKQSFKSRAERLADMKHAFAENPNIYEQFTVWLEGVALLTRPLRIIIVDDIYTTGSTIRACAEVVQQIIGDFGYEVEIYSLTWARS